MPNSQDDVLTFHSVSSIPKQWKKHNLLPSQQLKKIKQSDQRSKVNTVILKDTIGNHEPAYLVSQSLQDNEDDNKEKDGGKGEVEIKEQLKIK